MRISILLAFVSAMCLSILSVPAYAQATRTWVSGVGDDGNPCSRTTPCKTFAGAISKTAAGGEIDALDPGGFGALTITKSITIDGGGGQVASVLVAGTNAIVVAAGTNDVVILRNIRFQGLLGNGTTTASAGINGIRFLTGAALIVDHVAIYGFSNACIDIENSNTAKVTIADSALNNCAGGAILIAPSSGAATNAFITNTIMTFNKFGVRVQDNGKATVFESSASNNTNNGFLAASSATVAEINISNSTASHNGTNGIATSGGNAIVRIANTTVTDNATGINTGAGGTVTSYTPATNVNGGNGTPGAPNGLSISLQ
jgi:hypothetical protein